MCLEYCPIGMTGQPCTLVCSEFSEDSLYDQICCFDDFDGLGESLDKAIEFIKKLRLSRLNPPEDKAHE